MTDESQPLEPDRQIQDDLVNWGIPRREPPEPDYFHHDALISDEDVPPSLDNGAPRAD